MKTITHNLLDTLEGREIEVYRLLCENKTNAEIAKIINMSTATVCFYLRRIYKKLGVSTISGERDSQLSRRRAILYSGTKIEQVVSYGAENKKDKFFSLGEIKTAAKKTGLVAETIENLISFLEMGAE